MKLLPLLFGLPAPIGRKTHIGSGLSPAALKHTVEVTVHLHALKPSSGRADAR